MIFLVRHGQTDWNKKHIIQGAHTDTELNETGRKQAHERAKAFEGIHFDAVFTSPLKRARETAEILCEKSEVDEFIIDQRFIERDFGPIDGSKSNGRPLRFYYQDIEGAEDAEELYKRVSDAIRDIASKYKGNVLIVSHGGISGSYVSHQIGRDDFTLVNTAVVAINPEDGNLLDFNLSNDEVRELVLNTYHKEIDLDRINNFFNKNHVFFLATVNGDDPALRPFGGCAVIDNMLFIMTTNDKEVYYQMLENPEVQLAAVDKDNNTWVRATGTAEEKNEKHYRYEFFDKCSYLKQFFPDPDDPLLTVFGITIDKAEFYPEDYELPDLSGYDSLLFLVRHGETDYNRKNLTQGGEVDQPLNDNGRKQALERGKAFKGATLDAVIPSTLSRAVETAQLLTKEAEVGEFKRDGRLIERKLGHLNDQPLIGGPLSVYFHDLTDDTEKPDVMFERVDEAIKDITNTYSGDIVIVGHGGSLGNWLYRLTENENLDFTDNLSTVVLDAKTFEVLFVNASDYVIEACLKRKNNSSKEESAT